MANRRMENRARWTATLFLLLPAIVQLFPMFYVVTLSLKRQPEIFLYPPPLLPRALDFANYISAWHAAPLGRFLFNSLVVSLGITTLQVLTAILAAFALARMEFRGKKIAFGLILATMMVPSEITIIPNYFTLSRLEWLNTYRALIVPFAASGFGIFMLYGFFRTVPKELEEAAQLDGASPLRFLFQILVPVSMPAIVAFAVYSFVTAWNMYLWPLVVTQTTEMQTAQIGLGMFRSQNESVHWGIIMAATVMLLAPSLVLFILTQKQFVRGITASGVKG